MPTPKALKRRVWFCQPPSFFSAVHAGGSAGIGKATALQFDANGCTVAVMGRRLERLEAVVKQMKHGFSVVGDLTQAHDMERAVKEAIEKMGGLGGSHALRGRPAWLSQQPRQHEASPLCLSCRHPGEQW